MYTPRRDVRVMGQLGGPQQEGQKLIIIETPDAVGTRGLEVVCSLHPSHEPDVSGKHHEGEGGECGCLEQTEAVQGEQPDDEVELVPGSVVDSLAVAEGLTEVCGDFLDRSGVG